MTLKQLPPLLRHDPALVAVAGASSAVLAVPEPARAITVAGLCHLSDRRPIVVAVPTHADADRLVADLEAFLGPERVDPFPAWETLPFERVSPGVETMGRRLRAIWHLRRRAAGDDAGPSVMVATVKSLLQRLGPGATRSEPLVVRAGEQLDPEGRWPGLAPRANRAGTRASTRA